ncbi:DNA polymerase I [Haliea sp.]|jgi:DNA polymerase-1|uniref:DNA polymerase I n=1 Tax=Haliea TaxID=475794 RepID=UPI000C5D08FB|nr:DNA polymerase I [Haliea sp.]MAD63624.1 DNA polymerase I [Haliea sp.]MAY91985.1 DNA polymerase I [Haliea sp.]MBK41909.1 DNA polymerase I [Haliea sp.]HCD57150.1 DNA polymerase I [Halieaceae bacterium]|tara:strand:- start:7771 stop:10503 length:2733 start_codon:yes stop_codon:yes gene_type:complete
MADTTAPVVLVDGSSYLYRAFHALPPLNTSTGEPTGAVKGVISMLRRLLKDYPESPVAVVFDAKGKTFRDELFAEYKAQRPPMPDELRAQVEPIHAIVRAMGLPLICEPGVEADDVIGTLARQATECGRPVVISTGDKDMAQLVNAHTTLVNTMTDTRLDEAGVEEKFGIPPSRIIDFLALMGDKVDNIPGVPGVGEKTALALLQGLGGLDDIYAALDQVATLDFRGAKSMAAKLEAERERAYLSYQLATIKLDVPLQESVQALHNGEPDNAALREWYTRLEFRSWLEELLGNVEGVDAADSGVQPQPDTHWEVVTDMPALERWLAQLQAAELFAFDTETTSLNYMEAQVVGVSFAVEPGKAAYVPLAHDYLGAPAQLDRDEVLGMLQPLLEDPERAKVGQNLKYDASVLANHGINLRGIRHDTMLESYVLDSTATRHDMNSLALKYLGYKTIHFEDIAGKGAKQLTFNQVKVEDAGPYAAEDADVTLRLHQALWPRLSELEGPAAVYTAIELPLVPVLSRIERTGALVSRELLQQQSRELGERLRQLEAEAHDLAGEAFNLGSPKQLGEILFKRLELPVLRKTPTGAPSTAEEVLAELALDYPLPRVLLEYRGLSKLKSTYTDKLPELLNPRTGRIHTSYHQAVTATGRLSSSDPNLQNIPIRTEEGRRIRQAFIAPPGYRIVAADYSQIELRIMAHLSCDAGLLHAFREGLDVHRATAAEVFGVALDAVSAEQRRKAKAINFGLIYGMSAFGLARQLHLGRHEAQDYIDRYFERYPGVQDYMDRTRASAREQGYVETLFGRRLYLPEINARNKMRAQAAERTAINAPMQGTAADIIKRAMLQVDSWLQESDVDARTIMQVHDELVLEVAEDAVEQVCDTLCGLMSDAAELAVPLLVEAGSGKNWDEAH